MLYGCGHSIPAEFQPYVNSFVQDSVNQDHPVTINHLDIQFGQITNEQIEGQCNTGFLETPTILIQEDYWNTATEDEKTILMYHELGHCVLGRVHDNNLTGDIFDIHPISIMNWQTVSWQNFEEYKGKYLQELFSN